jgi:hypothetical protein
MYNLYEYNIKVDNSFFEDWLEDKNKIDELYVLYCISRLNHDIHKSIVFTNVHMLSISAQLQKVSSKNFVSVYNALIGLQDKGFIHMKVLDEKVTNKFMQPMKIYLLKTTPKRFTVIEHWMFDRSVNAKEFFIFSYIAKWKNSEHRISISEWANQMGYKSQGVEKLLKRMESDGRIKIDSGKFYYHDKLNRYIQEVNDYSSVYGDNDVISTVEGEFTVLEIREKVECNAWGNIEEAINMFSEIEQYDYNIYKMCKDHYLFPKFIVKCEAIIKKKKDSYTYDGMFERYEEKYINEKLAVT